MPRPAIFSPPILTRLFTKPRRLAFAPGRAKAKHVTKELSLIITGNGQHPGVVPPSDGGSDPAAAPFISTNNHHTGMAIPSASRLVLTNLDMYIFISNEPGGRQSLSDHKKGFRQGLLPGQRHGFQTPGGGTSRLSPCMTITPPRIKTGSTRLATPSRLSKAFRLAPDTPDAYAALSLHY